MVNKLIIPGLMVLAMLTLTMVTGNFLYHKAKIIAQNRQKLIQLNRDLMALDKILVDQRANQEKIEAVKRSLPESYEDVARSITQIERLASESSQKIETKLAERSIKENLGFSSLKLSLKTTGSYTGYANMLTGLSRLPYHSTVDSIRIEQTNEELSVLTDLRLFLGKEGDNE